jgi:hypothetical protein
MLVVKHNIHLEATQGVKVVVLLYKLHVIDTMLRVSLHHLFYLIPLHFLFK